MGMFDNLDNQPSKQTPTPQKKGGGDIDWKAELLSWKGALGVVVLSSGLMLMMSPTCTLVRKS